MKLHIVRHAKKPEYTIGRLFVDGKYLCDTCEDVVRVFGVGGAGKVSGHTAIPAGTYKVVLSMSNRFKKVLPEVLDVPFFTGIRFHSGNSAADSDGCILVGENKATGKVLNSRAAMDRLMALIGNEKQIELFIE